MRLVTTAMLAAILGVPGVPRAAELAGSEWRPVELGGAPIAADVRVWVRFEGEGKLTGHGGCNRFFGGFKLDGEQIEIGPMGATRMACPEAVMDLESKFLAALQQSRSFVRDKIRLTLSDVDGNLVARLAQTDAD